MGFPDFSMFDELEFEALSHTYSFKGETLPNVSSIMAPLTTEKYSGISQAVLDKAAERPTSTPSVLSGMKRIRRRTTRY